MPASDGPWTADAAATDVAGQVAGAPGVLCCLDFDGTLAPIVEDPDEATMTPPCRRAVRRLVRTESVDVALVSGRALADLRERVGLEGPVYAGNHGLELDRGDRAEVHPEATDRRAEVEAICDEVAARTADVPGVEVERKGVTATVHYRRVAAEDVPAVERAVERAVAAVTDGDASGDVEVLDGKQIFEVRPRVDWDKGRVVARLADDVPDDWAVVYVGDDTTDEDAFEVVEPAGLGVHVGDDEETAASVRVPDRAAVASVLERIADWQRDGGAGDSSERSG